MALKINPTLTPQKLLPDIRRLFDLSHGKILNLEKTWNPAHGTPVFTIKGRYTSRGWTEWTQGFQFGSALLQFEATGDEQFLVLGRSKTIQLMATHVSHFGVHDHGFNNVSTYGNLLRLMHEGSIPQNNEEAEFYKLALKISGAVQAVRWTPIASGQGFIYSFNGPHSLFIDTLRSLRSLALAHLLGHQLMGERDQKISLLQRLLHHAQTSADFSVYYGQGRDAYDTSGRTAHESIFNVNDGNYRCPNTQQGYSPFSIWTRGLAWAICGFAEQLEFLQSLPTSSLQPLGGRRSLNNTFLKAARATADFYIQNTCSDGVPIWDTGAPNLHRLGNYLHKPSNPYNDFEPVDSSAAAIAAQGLFRLGNFLLNQKDPKAGRHYRQAGLTVARTILNPPYLSTDPKHQGLILHSIYHRPNGWDYLSPRQKIPNGESSLWGDYHARELALLLLRDATRRPYLTFFNIPRN